MDPELHFGIVGGLAKAALLIRAPMLQLCGRGVIVGTALSRYKRKAFD